MLGPGTYEDPSCGFNSQFSCTVRGAVLGSTITNLIECRKNCGFSWSNLDILVNKINIPIRSAYKI